ncbi:hypothetical protein J6590_003648 [Homalodisca vitripennis]|nr:hypothetical protein J6590_003648 [Homalodisca vitripennis]
MLSGSEPTLKSGRQSPAHPRPTKHRSHRDSTKLSRFERSMSLPLSSPHSGTDSAYDSDIVHSPPRRMDFALYKHATTNHYYHHNHHYHRREVSGHVALAYPPRYAKERTLVHWGRTVAAILMSGHFSVQWLSSRANESAVSNTVFVGKHNKPIEIYRKLCEVCWNDVITEGGVCQWCIRFKNGRTNVHDDECSGRPSIVTDEIALKSMRRLNRTADSQ